MKKWILRFILAAVACAAVGAYASRVHKRLKHVESYTVSNAAQVNRALMSLNMLYEIAPTELRREMMRIVQESRCRCKCEQAAHLATAEADD